VRISLKFFTSTFSVKNIYNIVKEAQRSLKTKILAKLELSSLSLKYISQLTFLIDKRNFRAEA
jgi:hypothetical protein